MSALCRTALAVCVAAAVLALGPAQRGLAQAGGDDGAAAERADELIEQARVAAEAQRFAEARDFLREALALDPRPATAFNLALVLRDHAEVVAAVALLDELLAGRHGELPDDRRARAVELRAELSAQMGTIAITLTGSGTGTIQIDAEPAQSARGGDIERIQVDPGDHVVRFTFEGRSEVRRVSVRPGDSAAVAFEASVPAPLPESDPRLPPPTAPTPTRDEDTEGGSVASSPWLWLAIGLAVAAGVGITLALTLGQPGEELPPHVVGEFATLRW